MERQTIDYAKLDEILNRQKEQKPKGRNYKKDLLNILDRTEVALNRFNMLKGNIEREFSMQMITEKAREKKTEELIKETGEAIESIRADGLKVIDDGLEALKNSWDNKSVEAYSDSGLANIILMINNGAIPDEDELNAIAKQYEDNPTAVESIKKALDKNGANLSLQFIKETPKERTTRLMADVRRNMSERWHRGAMIDLPLSVEGLRDFINSRVADDFTVMQ